MSQSEEGPRLRGPKVVHVIVAGHLGGAEHFLANLAGHAGAEDVVHCVALMTPNPKLREYFASAGLLVRDRGPVRENPFAYLWRSFGPSDIGWLRGILLEERADVVHAHTFGSQVLAARVARQLGIPLVRTEHGVGVYRDPSRAFLRKWALRRADRVIAVSEFVKQTIEDAYPSVRRRLSVIRNGVDTAHFRPAPLQDGPFTFSMLTRLEPVKRVDLAIEALRLVPNAYLEISGQGSKRTELETLANRRGVANRVRFCGYRSDPREVLSRCDVLVNCTREEGLGLAVIEASAMERPAVAFAGGGIPEVVLDGRTGWLVHEHNAAGFARAMSSAVDREQARRLGINARKRAIELFDVKQMRRDYARVYRELVGLGPESRDASNLSKESLPD